MPPREENLAEWHGGSGRCRGHRERGGMEREERGRGREMKREALRKTGRKERGRDVGGKKGDPVNDSIF